MTVSAQDVFVKAMVLMDEETEDGAYTGYPDEYKKKAWPILSILQAEMSLPTDTLQPITSETDAFQIDDRLATTALPYGLAAHLLMTEDQNRAGFFNARYDELKRQYPPVATGIDINYSIDPTGDDFNPFSS